MRELRRQTVLLLLAGLALPAGAQRPVPVQPPVLAQPAVLRPKVVVVAYFELGEDTGDKPGEVQYWVERDHLDRVIEVPGMTHAVRANAEGTEIALVIGPSDIKPAINLMALGGDPRFDLRQSWWLVQGIAGISPFDGTIGSAVWTDFVVNGTMAKQIDAREIPKEWPDGYAPLSGAAPSDDKKEGGLEDDVRTWGGTGARANRRGNVIRLNLALMQWAYALTKDVPLKENAAMKALRERYTNRHKWESFVETPHVLAGASLDTETFWHGAKMDDWAHRWVVYETDGVAHFVTTENNDSGTLLALQALTQQGKADWNRALLLRTASNFDMPPAGVTAADNLATEQHGGYTGYLASLEAAYVVGHKVVMEWLKQAETQTGEP
jgi:purine nucleoside permease